jgi:hypothetical protein
MDATAMDTRGAIDTRGDTRGAMDSRRHMYKKAMAARVSMYMKAMDAREAMDKRGAVGTTAIAESPGPKVVKGRLCCSSSS